MCIRDSLYTFGVAGGINIFDEGGTDITGLWREDRPGELARLERIAERRLLAGPSDAQVPELRRKGYRPEASKEMLNGNLAFDIDLSKNRLDSHWRRGRLKDVIAARHMFYELNEIGSAQLLAEDGGSTTLGRT